MSSVDMVSIHSTYSSKSLINMLNRASPRSPCCGEITRHSPSACIQSATSTPNSLSSSPRFLNKKIHLRALLKPSCIRYFTSHKNIMKHSGKCLDELGFKRVISPFGADRRAPEHRCLKCTKSFSEISLASVQEFLIEKKSIQVSIWFLKCVMQILWLLVYFTHLPHTPCRPKRGSTSRYPLQNICQVSWSAGFSLVSFFWLSHNCFQMYSRVGISLKFFQ